jgi:transcriptional regulator with XRE-family HTH domain
MIDTQARQQLEETLNKRGFSQAELARTLGISAVSVNAWLAGRARPEAHWRRALQEIFGIDPLAWETDCERAQYERAVSRPVAEVVDGAAHRTRPRRVADGPVGRKDRGGCVMSHTHNVTARSGLRESAR